MSDTKAQPAPGVVSPIKDGTYPKTFEFSGTGLPGWWVHFYTIPIDPDNPSFGGVQVDAASEWSFTMTLESGSQKVRGFQTDNRERSENTDIIEFTVS